MTKFKIGDRVKPKGAQDASGVFVVDGVGSVGVNGQVHFVSNGDAHFLETDVELYAKAGEFVEGDWVKPANAQGGPWKVLDTRRQGDGQRISFPGEYGQWWSSAGYRLATPEEIAAAEGKAEDWSARISREDAAAGRGAPAEIPAAEFDFSTIKAGDEVIIRWLVVMDGVDHEGFIGLKNPDFGLYYIRPTSGVVAVIPAPKPKTLRERITEAVEKGSTLAGIVDAVLAEVEKG